MSIYEVLGVRKLINADATLTRLGGSLMPPEVLNAMVEASRHWVNLPDFQRKIGERIAALTRNEACFVSTGAAAGLTLITAACVAGNDKAKMDRLPDTSGMKNEVIIHRSHRNGYDFAVRQVGIKLIEIGDGKMTHREDLEAAINPNTAAIFWFVGWMEQDDDVPFETVIEIANKHNVPVIVDAAAQLPPAENLWKYTHAGASAAIFSGGKDLHGPQTTGLVLGKKSLIDLLPALASPNQGIGRPMKVGKEEMAGLLAAVERYLKLDHAMRAEYCEETVADWCGMLNTVPGVQAERSFPNEARQPLPRCHVTLDNAKYQRDGVVQAMLEGEPGITISAGPNGNDVYLNPMTLELGEEMTVLKRLVEVLRTT